MTAEEISTRYIAECKKDMEGMNVRPATTHPLATREKFPSDFDIFLLSIFKNALCIQYLEKVFPFAASDWAISFSELLDADIEALIAERQAARKSRSWPPPSTPR